MGIALPVSQFHKTSDGKIKANQVLERLPLGHTRTQFIRLHLDLAAFLFQYPHISGVPLLDLVTVTATGKKAVPVYEDFTAFLLNQNLKLVCLTNDVETGAADCYFEAVNSEESNAESRSRYSSFI